MTAKEYLNQPKELLQQIEYKKKLIESYKDMASSISSPSFDEHLSGTKNTDPIFVRYIDKIDELKDEINKDYSRLTSMKEQIEHSIELVDSPTERLVLHYRYIQLYSEQVIADKLHYSKRWIRQLHSNAVSSIEKKAALFLSVPPTSS